MYELFMAKNIMHASNSTLARIYGFVRGWFICILNNVGIAMNVIMNPLRIDAKRPNAKFI